MGGEVPFPFAQDAKVYSVLSVEFSLMKSNPPQLLVQADGKTRTTGWTNGRLIPWTKVNDGILDFDFIATAPMGQSLPKLTNIDGAAIAPFENWIEGVRVHASTNQIEAVLDRSRAVEVQLSDLLPWHWLERPEKD